MNPLRTLSTYCLSVVAMTSLLAGCGEPDDRPSEIVSLRVLAVRAESPFVVPGESTKLSLLAYDGSPRARLQDGSQRKTSTIWIGGCVNPAGDSYVGCSHHLHQVVNQLDETTLRGETLPDERLSGVVGFGSEFTVRTPSDMISSRDRAAGVVYPYGLELVFFAHCGGVLKPIDVDESMFPLGCFDAKTGEALGRDDFEFGFFSLYAYDSVTNENPILNGMSFDGHDGTVACSDLEPCASGFHCSSEATCIPVVTRCKASKESDCQKYRVTVDVPRASRETAVTAHVDESEADTETLWVSYYASEGSFEEDARIISDPNSGWGKNTFGEWKANTHRSGEVRLFAVARDNRNGVAWSYRDVWVD
ncbi:MAG: hypothetical protein QM784_33840 [Polyangiaceae bacterium]